MDYSLGRSLAFIPYIIYKLFFSSKSENQLSSNFCIKDWIIFILMIFLQSLYNLTNLFIYNYSKYYDYISNYIIDSFSEILIIIILSLLMKFMNDFNFHIHHKISIIISCLFTFIFGFIIIYNMKCNSITLFIMYSIMNFFNIFIESISIFYQKYLMDKKNISFYLCCSFCGIFDFINSILYDWLFKEKISFNFSDLFNTNTISSNILYIICDLGLSIIYYKAVYEFDAINGEIVYVFFFVLYSLSIILFENISTYYDCLIAFDSILLLLFLFVYEEIIELNFCGLNENTRRNILIREKREAMDLNQFMNEELENENSNSKFEFSKGYYIELNNRESENSL